MMHPVDLSYIQLLRDLIEKGEPHENRTGVPTRRQWGANLSFDLQRAFPLLSVKRMAIKTAFTEMLGFIRGETDIRWYQERGCHVWDADHARWHGQDLKDDEAELQGLLDQERRYHGEITNAQHQRMLDLRESVTFRKDSPHSLGEIYGAQWRDFSKDATRSCVCDQLADVHQQLKNRSSSRRLIISGWAPHKLHLMCLPPCHVLYQFSTRGESLDIAVYQRSCDVGIGLPFNLANTALFCHVMAHCAGLKPGKMLWSGADVHLYEPHVELLRPLLFLCPEYPQDPPPRLEIRSSARLPWEIDPLDLHVVDYHPGAKITLPFFAG